MLKRKLPGGFVCLRCRLQLSGPAPRRLFSTTAHVRHESHTAEREINASADDKSWSFSRLESQLGPTTSLKPKTKDSLLDALDQFEANKDFIKFEDDKAESKQICDEIDGEYEHDDGGYTAPQRKARYSRGKYTVSGEDLPINVLGAPKDVMVVRPRSLPARQAPPAVNGDEDTTSEIIELLAQQHIDLKVKKIKPMFRDVMASLEELRPKNAGMLAAEDFVDLREQIVSEFTIQQLKAYLSTTDSKLPTGKQGQAQAHHTPSYPWMLNLQTWEPLDHAAAQEDTPQGYFSETSTAKQKLAIRIMRMSWGLASRGGIEVRGRLKVQIRDPEFKLLTREVYPTPKRNHDLIPPSCFQISRAEYLQDDTGTQ